MKQKPSSSNFAKGKSFSTNAFNEILCNPSLVINLKVGSGILFL
jgi:hypothetical protein